ncbi:MAG: hypothetical protein ABIY70_20925 [Capsulimonas sp.]|uniref:hypothetical protein n=1 Tax=Capsulimonas sp. TaxID=2494211 RepID=UPI0032653637
MKPKQTALAFPLVLLLSIASIVVRAYIAPAIRPAAQAGEPRMLQLPKPHHMIKRHVKPTWDTTKRVALPPRKTVAQQIADLKTDR